MKLEDVSVSPLDPVKLRSLRCTFLIEELLGIQDLQLKGIARFRALLLCFFDSPPKPKTLNTPKTPNPINPKPPATPNPEPSPPPPPQTHPPKPRTPPPPKPYNPPPPPPKLHFGCFGSNPKPYKPYKPSNPPNPKP